MKNHLSSSADRRSVSISFVLLAGSVCVMLVSIAAAQILLAAALAGALWTWWRAEARPVWLPVFWPLSILFLWTILAALVSPDVPEGLAALKKLFLFLPLILAPWIMQAAGQSIRVYRALFLVAAATATAGVVQFIQDPTRDALHRITGFMSHWMTFTGLLMLVVVVLGAYALCFGWRKRLWILPLFTVLGAALLLVFAISPENMQRRLTSAWDLQDPNTRNRLELIETSGRLIRDNPWFGVGPTSVGGEALRYRGDNEFPDWMYQHMHNNILQLAAERGIPGVLLWLWFMSRLAWDAFLCFRRSGRARGTGVGREARMVSTAALGSWVALMAAGMFEYNFGDSEVLFLFLFIMSAPYAWMNGKALLPREEALPAGERKVMGTAAAPWIIFSNFLRKIILQRDLIRNFVVRDLQARYIGSFIGFFWSVIHPIVLLVSYTFVFMFVFGIRPRPDTGTTNFPLFLFCGILPWLFFQDTLQRASTVIIDNANLVKKTVFPTEILPLTVMLAAVVNHIIGFIILMGILMYSKGEVSVFILLVPVYFFILMLFALGLSWIVAALNVFVRDISQVVSVILTFWFWFTPIFYSPALLLEQNEHLAFLMRLNPMAHVVLGYKDCLLRMQMPDLTMLALLALGSLIVFMAGGMFFRHLKREFVDVL